MAEPSLTLAERCVCVSLCMCLGEEREVSLSPSLFLNPAFPPHIHAYECACVQKPGFRCNGLSRHKESRWCARQH
jgi:hypothetical protein